MTVPCRLVLTIVAIIVSAGVSSSVPVVAVPVPVRGVPYQAESVVLISGFVIC